MGLSGARNCRVPLLSAAADGPAAFVVIEPFFRFVLPLSRQWAERPGTPRICQ